MTKAKKNLETKLMMSKVKIKVKRMMKNQNHKLSNHLLKNNPSQKPSQHPHLLKSQKRKTVAICTRQVSELTHHLPETVKSQLKKLKKLFLMLLKNTMK